MTIHYRIVSVLLVIPSLLLAGNPDRAGEAGAYELTMIPWARSASLNYLYSARVYGIEALRLNPGGLTATPGTEFALSHALYYTGGALRLSALGVAQQLSEDNFLGIEAMLLSAGEIPVTTVDQPEGTGAVVEPVFINVAIGYARIFSEFIHVGFVIRTIYEAIKDAYAAGVAFDAGVQYRTRPAPNRQLSFGVALRNIGFPIRYRGPGLKFENKSPFADYTMTMEIPTENFELPLLLHIGFAYDHLFTSKCIRVTGLFNFTSNTFGDDLIGGGVELAYKEMSFLRAGYTFEKGIFAPVGIQKTLDIRKLHLRSGFSAGLGVQLPFKKPEGDDLSVPALAIDYAIRPTRFLGYIHTLTIRFGLKQQLPSCITGVEVATPRM